MAGRLIITPRAERDLKKLPAPVAARIVATMMALAAGKLPNADVKKLEDRNPPEYRLRVGNHRAIFERAADGNLILLRVADRREAYR
jgi:mRNA-degrading endonuclease RelE of RelBE toxin-antitoxin system